MLQSDSTFNAYSEDSQCITVNQSSCAPEFDIELLDGSKITCLPKPEVGIIEAIQGWSNDKLRNQLYDDATMRHLFLNYAAELFSHSQEILSDSMLFFTPVPVVHSITGPMRLDDPTLGVYIEWWKTCDGSRWTDNNGDIHLVYQLNGSPFCGANLCGATYNHGHIDTVRLQPFHKAVQSFADINNRYAAYRDEVIAYNMRDALYKLFGRI